MLYQLSYEATDIGSRSIVGSYVPVKEMSVNDMWNKSYMNCGNEMKQCLWTVIIAINTITLFLTLKLRHIFNYDLCSDVDDFIVDDEGNPIRQAKKKRRLHGAVHDS